MMRLIEEMFGKIRVFEIYYVGKCEGKKICLERTVM